MRARDLWVLAPPAGLAALFTLSTWVGCSSESSSVDPAGEVGGGDTLADAGSGNLCVKDKTALEITYCPDHKSFVDIVGACGIECVLAANRKEETPTCVQDCLRKATSSAISEACLNCQAGLVACARANCLGACAPGPSTAKCLDCMCGHNYPDGGGAGINCYDPFNACSGLATDYCQQMEAGTFDGFTPPNDGGACEASTDAAVDAPTDSGSKDAASDAPKDAPKDAPTDTPKDAAKDGG